MRYILLLSAAALLAARGGLGQAPQPVRDPTEHEQAVALIRKLGGEVIVGSKQSGAGVTVVLTGCAHPGDCLPLLKGLSDLRGCNL